MSDPIEIRNSDDSWRPAFERAALWLRSALGPGVRFEHVGSTAVPGLGAKAILDILVGVGDQRDLPNAVRGLEALGFVSGASLSPPDRSAFLRRPAGEGEPPINLHLTLVDSYQWLDLLRFRDKLRADPGLAQTYENLKRRLAAASEGDLDAYTAGKSIFVAKVLEVSHS